MFQRHISAATGMVLSNFNSKSMLLKTY